MKTKSFIYIVIAGILWGTSGIFVNILAPYGFSSLQLTFLRALISLLSMLFYILVSDKKLFKARLKHIALFALSGVSFFGTSAFYYASMRATSISTAVILMYTAPIIVMIFSVLFFGEQFNLLKGCAVAIMLVGCGLVSGIIGGMKFNLLGILLGFGAGFAYSAYNIFTKLQMRKSCNAISSTFHCFVFASIAAALVCNPVEIFTFIPKNPSVIIPAIVGIGVCTCVLPYFLYTLALKNLPVGTASALGIIEPMSATLFSVMLGEKLGIPALAGIVLILSAVFMLSKTN